VTLCSLQGARSERKSAFACRGSAKSISLASNQNQSDSSSVEANGKQKLKWDKRVKVDISFVARACAVMNFDTKAPHYNNARLHVKERVANNAFTPHAN
jgi:hypothetical protein